jgi:hypothetical protein
MQTKLILFIFFGFSLLYAEKFTLEELCRKGIRSNPNIKSFSYRSLTGASAYDQSVGHHKPHLNASGQYGVENYDLGDSLKETHYQWRKYSYILSVSQPVF